MSAIGAITICVCDADGLHVSLLNVMQGNLTVFGELKSSTEALNQIAEVMPAEILREALAKKESGVKA